MILRMTRHSELPREEIQFLLHVDGAKSWSWADIKNNGAVSNPSVNPWNEAQVTSPDPQHGRGPEKVKPLAQYLVDYLQHEHPVGFNRLFWKRIIEQALDAYESTEQVKIRIEQV